jgi:hypothetical protein
MCHHYLWDYKAEMLQCKISEGLQVLSFNRVATNELQGSILETRQQHPTGAVFEAALKITSAIEDSSKATQRGFEDWLDIPTKGLMVLEIFTEFQKHFGRLSARD